MSHSYKVVGLALTAALALPLGGCGEGNSFERFEPGYRDKARTRIEGVVGSFYGANEQWMIQELGRPRDRYDYSNGGRDLTWSSGRRDLWCEVKVTLDDSGKVTSAAWRDSGNLGGRRECDVWLSYVSAR